MDDSVRASLRRMDAGRGDWWLVRRDEWPQGRWALSCDPQGSWDWRYRIGSSKCRAVRRLRAALTRQTEEQQRQRKMQKFRGMVDRLRSRT
jgi:hypothetical protein